MPKRSSWLVTFLNVLLTTATPVPGSSSPILSRSSTSSSSSSGADIPLQYAPTPAECPSEALVRPAIELNPLESAWVSQRRPKADAALAAWLTRIGDFSTDSLPMVGFTSSGGGYRALTTSAGVMKGFDGREADTGVAGLYQAFTYQTGLSGGSWFVGSVAGSNWPTISTMESETWTPGLNNTGFVTDNLFGDKSRYDSIINAIASKAAFGDKSSIPLSIVDPYGLIIGSSVLPGDEMLFKTRLSDIKSLSNFTSFNVPFPIITALGLETPPPNGSTCIPPSNATQYEFTPFEWGSWDRTISAFSPTDLMGTTPDIANTDIKTGKVKSCVQGYDSLSYIMGTSGNVFNVLCSAVSPADSISAGVWEDYEGMMLSAAAKLNTTSSLDQVFARYPNPFYSNPSSIGVNTHKTLTLVDGSESGQDIPIWPFLQPSTSTSTTNHTKYIRPVDVLLAVDTSPDTITNTPDGSSLYTTYQAAQSSPAMAARMPLIPPPVTFLLQGLNTRPTFFGCSTKNTTTPRDQMLIVYLPNTPITYPSGVSSFTLVYTPEIVKGMIGNGHAMATQTGVSPSWFSNTTSQAIAEEWPFCLACAVKHRDEKLPDGCEACFQKYCYHP